MSTQTESRRRRSTAKGSVTKAATSISTLRDLSPSRLDLAQIKRLRDNIYRAEEAFSSSHQSIVEAIPETDIEQLQAEEVVAEEFDRTVFKLMDSLQFLQDQHRSFHLLQRVEIQLDGYENLNGEDIVTILPGDIPKLEKLFDEFVDSLTTPGARECPELRRCSNDFRRRITHLKKSLSLTEARSCTSLTSISTRSSVTATKLPQCLYQPLMVTFWSGHRSYKDSLTSYQSTLN